MFAAANAGCSGTRVHCGAEVACGAEVGAADWPAALAAAEGEGTAGAPALLGADEAACVAEGSPDELAGLRAPVHPARMTVRAVTMTHVRRRIAALPGRAWSEAHSGL